ncbi:hypothetical protein BH23PLA1_BH23PLA1_25790 [soil metagenome]
MSWWITRSSKEGGRDIWLIDGPSCTFLVMLLGLLLAILLPMPSILRQTARTEPEGFVVAALGFLVVGVLCLVVPKVSLFRRGIWTSWGPKLMTRWNARMYKAGYTAIGIGTGLLLFMVLAL